MTATFVETLWLRGQDAQRDMVHLASYGAAFVGTASLQTMHMGLCAPRSFWAAMARAVGRSERQVTAPDATVAAPAAKNVAPADLAPVVEDAPVRPDDDLCALSGVGAKLAATLKSAGITRFDQVAALDAAAIDRLEARQKGFRMICTRYDLPAQARARL